MMDYEALGRRLVACNGWRWLPGMCLYRSDGDAERRMLATPEGEVGHPFDWYGGVYHGPDEGDIPDLRDPCTRGGVLHLVRVAMDCPFAHVEQVGDGRWYLVVNEDCAATGDTEIEALVRGLEDVR